MLAGRACVGWSGGELRSAAGAPECVCRRDAGAALPAASLLPPLLFGQAPVLQVRAGFRITGTNVMEPSKYSEKGK